MTVTIEVPAAAAAAQLERFAARCNEVRHATMAAPHGQALAACEDAAVAAAFASGRDLIEQALVARIADLEKKAPPSASAAGAARSARGRARAAC